MTPKRLLIIAAVIVAGLLMLLVKLLEHRLLSR
jgi:hypothetical protein